MAIGVNFWTKKNIWFHILNEVAVPLYKRCWFMPHDRPLFFDLRLIHIRQKKNTIYLTVKIADGAIDTFQCFCHALFSSFECRPLISAVPQVMKYCTTSNWCMFLILVFEMNLIQKVPKSPTWLNATIICKSNRKK